ncbi:hypothetical protein B0H11DRAFT_2076221 [Mycena galericulata]|nr:hypothetical protein B0H11DRAFT_2076221 [Mycena galericulata]
MSTGGAQGRILLCRGPRAAPQASSAAVRQRCAATVHTAAFKQNDIWIANENDRCSHLFSPTEFEAPQDWDWGSMRPPGRRDCGCARDPLACGGCGSVIGTAGKYWCELHANDVVYGRHPYQFLAASVYAVPLPDTRRNHSDSATLRSTHAPSRRGAGGTDSGMETETRPEFNSREGDASSLDDMSEDAIQQFEEIDEPPRYFENDAEVRAKLIAILESYIGELDPDAELVYPSEKIAYLNPADELMEEKQADAGDQAARLERITEQICRERQRYEARVKSGSPPQISNPDVAEIDITPEGKTRITLNPIVLQMAEGIRAMAYSQSARSLSSRC